MLPTNANTTSPSGYYLTGWTNLPSATYTTNTAALNTTFAFQSISVAQAPGTIRVAPGQVLAVRFGNSNDAGTDALIGVDDLSITFSQVNGIHAEISNATRNTHGTPGDPADDTMDFNLTVVKTAIPGETWHATSAPLSGVVGSYGAPVSVSVPISHFAAAPHSLSVAVADDANASAISSVFVTAPWCSITPTLVSRVVNTNGTSTPADDTLSATVSATATYGGPTYTLSAGGPSLNFAYGSPLVVSGPSLTGPTTLTFSDDGDPACTASLLVEPPTFMGQNFFTGGPVVVAPGASPAWVISGDSLTKSGSVFQGDQIIESDLIDLSTVSAVRVAAVMDAIAGITSGFEATDSFRLDLIGNGGAPISMLGAHDTDGNGALTGNFELPASFMTNTTLTYAFSHLIPASANSLRIRITGNSNSIHETLVVHGVIVAPAPGVGDANAEIWMEHVGVTVMEGYNLQLEVRRSGNLAFSSVVDVALAPTPAAGRNYTVADYFTLPASMRLTFAAGETVAYLSIPTRDDSLDHGAGLRGQYIQPLAPCRSHLGHDIGPGAGRSHSRPGRNWDGGVSGYFGCLAQRHFG